jgi:hypothetical protein
VWTQVELALARGANAGDAPLDPDPPLDSRGVPWPLSASLLVANGWFVSPRGFESVRHIPKAGLRMLAFAGAGIAAVLWLPPLPGVVALAAWVAFITPKVRWLGREFQHVDVPPGPA